MAHILGFGGYVPDRVMTNDDWAKLVDTSDEWLVQRTGIRERRIAADDQSTLDLAEQAALRAIEDAGLSPDDIDEVILASDTPEARIPDTSAYLQHRLGLRQVPTFDLGGSGCAGFVLAVDVARARIAQRPKLVLVVGVEVITKLLSWKERDTTVLFGDAAGAVIMGPDPGRAEVLEVVAGTDGSKADILMLGVGGTSQPFDEGSVARGDYNVLVMDGQQVFKNAVNHMTASVRDVLDRVGRSIDDVALLIPHQANKRILDAVGRKLGTSDGQVYVNVDRFGNTGSASVPLALWEAEANGQIAPGDLVILTAFGAGLHWASAAVQF